MSNNDEGDVSHLEKPTPMPAYVQSHLSTLAPHEYVIRAIVLRPLLGARWRAVQIQAQMNVCLCGSLNRGWGIAASTRW